MHMVRLLRKVRHVPAFPSQHAQRGHGQLLGRQPSVLDANSVRQRSMVERGERDCQDRSDDDHGAWDQGRGEQVRHDRQELRRARRQENTHSGAEIGRNILHARAFIIYNLMNC